jgi:hypothetical protein
MNRLIATTAHGVELVEDFEGLEDSVIDQKVFYESLSDLEDDEIIACEASDEMLEKIKKEYGVR